MEKGLEWMWWGLLGGDGNDAGERWGWLGYGGDGGDGFKRYLEGKINRNLLLIGNIRKGPNYYFFVWFWGMFECIFVVP